MNDLEHHSGPKPGPEPERKTLKEVFDRAEYPLTGHGRREVDVLKAALAGVDGGLESDTYGAGKVIEDFEAKMAGVLGKGSAALPERSWRGSRSLRRSPRYGKDATAAI